jgi:methionyl-tRNA formyltransferase
MSDPLNLAFCGTPRFAVPTLEKLVEAGLEIRLVVTQPDKPRGRGLELSFSPVKQRALDLGLPITQPEKIRNNADLRTQLEALDLDAIVVVGYGKIIPQWMIDLPPMGNLNLHASLLPKYRGAAPIQWAIASGEAVTGVTTMRINAGLDTGDILLQEEVPIAPDDTSVTLSPRLANLGANLMLKTVEGLRLNTIMPRSQDDTAATHAPVLKREDGLINFDTTAVEIFNRLRGFQPWPGAYTQFRGKSLHVWSAKPLRQPVTPAEIKLEADRLFAGCGDQSSLELLEVQLEGKKRVSARDFVHGYRPHTGEKFGG